MMPDISPLRPRNGLRIGALALAAAFTAAGAPAAAQNSDPVEDVLSCRSLADAAERLACFDSTTGQLAQATESGAVAVVLRERIEAVERESFGIDLPSLPRLSLSIFGRGDRRRAPDPLDVPRALTAEQDSTAQEDSGVQIVERGEDGSVDRVLMTIARIDVFNYNQHRFRMENGQVWRQVDTSRVQIPRGEANQAEIRRAAGNSYLLRINGQGLAIRVIREN